LYDRDPNHLWNRLYRALYERVTKDGKEYGYDELDPLLWWETKYLLTDPGHQRAVAVLDEFLTTAGEKAVADPLKRAILQRDLWAVFDWTTKSPEPSVPRLHLQNRLAAAIKRLALRPEQIAGLPDFYRQAIEAKTFAPAYDSNKPSKPFLPVDLFDENGPWVMLSARGGEPIAFSHAHFVSGRSVFLTFIRLPGGRAATLTYLKSLGAYPKPWVRDPNDAVGLLPNPSLPQFPPGTQLALVRKAVLIDSQGILQTTNISEDIQIRVHKTIPTTVSRTVDLDHNEARVAVDVFEFKLSRQKLFAADSGGLRAVATGEIEFALFSSHGIDFEQRESLAACAMCHFQPGVHSVLSRGRLQPGGRDRVEVVPSWDLNYEANTTKSWKGRQYDWGLLQGLWRSQVSR
jgi:hypothetical protein